MSALERIAHFQNRRDEVPNQDLARDLASKKDRGGIREIAQNLWNKDKNIQADCIKVLYEIGYLNPALVAGYAAPPELPRPAPIEQHIHAPHVGALVQLDGNLLDFENIIKDTFPGPLSTNIGPSGPTIR